MKVELENTSKVVEFVVNGVKVPARIWEGETDTGIKVHAYITRIVIDYKDETRSDEFEKELQSVKAPSAELQSIPLRLII